MAHSAAISASQSNLSGREDPGPTLAQGHEVKKKSEGRTDLGVEAPAEGFAEPETFLRPTWIPLGRLRFLREEALQGTQWEVSLT